MNAVKTFTRSTLRDLKIPRKQRPPNADSSFTSLTSSIQSKEIKNEYTSELPNFRIDNSQNIMLLIGDDERDAKVIVESFL